MVQDSTRGTALVNLLLQDRQFLARTIIDNNFPAVARNMQRLLGTSATFTPSGLEAIVMQAKTPERVALMDQVLDVPWMPTEDPGVNRAIQQLQERAGVASSGSAVGTTRFAGADVAASGLLGLVGIVGGLIGGGRAQREAEQAQREAQAAAERAADRRRQVLIIASLAIGTLVVVLILYKLSRR